MENVSGVGKEDDQMDLPPGFRFHPTDEELITHYLYKKVLDVCFSCRAIGDVDLNKNEPWELPCRFSNFCFYEFAFEFFNFSLEDLILPCLFVFFSWGCLVVGKAKMGEKEWYFFCMRDRKYPTGLRTNRATVSGYWKATGKDKEIYRGKSLVGMKKTLVFYRGRAPKGEKSSWVMHEYRLDGKFSVHSLPKTAKVCAFSAVFSPVFFPLFLSTLFLLTLFLCFLVMQNEWVLCRVFQKGSGGKKTHISGLAGLGSFGNELGPPGLPPLMDSSPDNGSKTIKSVADSAYVSCFSNSIDLQRNQKTTTTIENFFNNPPPISVSSNCPDVFPRIPLSSNSFYSPLSVPVPSHAQFPGSVFMQDHSILRALIENQGSNMSQSFKTEREMISVSQDTGLTADMNPEISSVVSNLEMVKRPFNDHDAPSTSAGPVDFDCFWNY